jgi:lipopolysaccharide/colanic/teichoic acid biosynthesis glycosyltransferase
MIFSCGFPLFYFQIRVGKNGKDFKLFKFRTMHLDADKKGLLTVGGRDPRVTTIGYYLRKYKLDELPQLLNVLKGNMSLVGPRPLLPEYVHLYSDYQNQRHQVLPGITGYVQVKGRNALTWEARFDLDVYYVQHISFLFDCKILL